MNENFTIPPLPEGSIVKVPSSRVIVPFTSEESCLESSTTFTNASGPPFSSTTLPFISCADNLTDNSNNIKKVNNFPILHNFIKVNDSKKTSFHRHIDNIALLCTLKSIQ